MAILDISKIVMCEFWYDHMKPKFGDNVKLCYRDTDSFIIYIEKEDFYEDIADDDRPFLPTGKIKKEIGLMKNELGGKIMTEFVPLGSKTCAYLVDYDASKVKKAKGTNKCVIKNDLKFNDYKDCILNNKIVLKSQQ